MDFRFLDKDLDKVANAESAGVYSTRPLLRLGLALTFAAAVTVAGAVATGAGGSWMLAAGLMVGAFLALSIGASDVANALGPAFGAGAVSMRAGLVSVALAEIAGALTAGARVSETLSTGILRPELVAGGGTAPVMPAVMLAAMLAAALWIWLATWAGAPVSTTHAIVGGIAGAGVARLGLDAPHWAGVARIAMGWVASPLIAAVIGAALLAFLRARIHHAPDRIAAAMRWLPRVVGAGAAVLAAYALTLWGAPGRPALALALVALTSVAAWWATRARMRSQRMAGLRPREATERLFGPSLIAAALLIGFGHGANDVGNVVAPLAVIARAGDVGAALPAAPVWLATGALGFALGAALYGRRLVRMVGSRITRLNPARALCVSLATALVLLGATWLGLPVSTTHVAVGGVFGVGFYREWDERRTQRSQREALPPEELHRRRLVRRTAVLRTLAAWAVTVPISGSLAAAIAWAMG